MKTRFSLSLVACLASLNFVLLAPDAHAEDAAPAQPQSTSTQALFNGKNLDGWHGQAHFDPYKLEAMPADEREAMIKQWTTEAHEHWTVDGDELVNDGKGPYLTTNDEFDDYELELEYKTVAKADSGIYLKGTPQVQIWDSSDESKFALGANLGSGALWNNSPGNPGKDPLVLADRPFGEWNKVRIVQVGARTSVWLNDKQVVDKAIMDNYWRRDEPLRPRGPIQLQTHGGEIRWRNIFVREIGEQESKRILAAYQPLPQPTQYDVAYGSHPKQVLHFWKAESDEPTPVLFFIHGGGWSSGGRLSGLVGMLPTMLKEGISVVSVEYRFIAEATADGVTPPVKGPLEDVARALQFIRSKATDWNLDKERIGASGGSAGACSSLWLAFHPDMADSDNEDAVARESTRLWCAAVTGAQTTLDPKQMKEWTPNSRYGGHAFGFLGDRENKLSAFDQFLAERDTILPWIAEYSPYALVSSDDPPVYLSYSAAPALGKNQKDPTHTANFGVKLQERCEAAGVDCELVYPGAENVKHATTTDYLIWKLKHPNS